MKIIELCITYRCNLKCNNCSNLCAQALFKGDLSPVDVQLFVDNLLSSNFIPDQITIHGGEPVLHPSIFEIITILCKYREKTGTRLWLLTNNSNGSIKNTIERVRSEYNIPIGSSEKDVHCNSEFVTVNESPSDLLKSGEIQLDDITKGCFQLTDCGICFNYLGYFPCSPMAAAARIFNYQSLGSDIKNLYELRLLKKALDHCKHCGFAIKNRDRSSEQIMTETWKNKLINYHQGVISE
jgi:hypothetical protein